MLCLVHRYLWKVPEHVYAAFKKQADAGSEKCLGAECCKVGKVQITAFLGSELGPDRGERNKQLRGLASLFDSLSSLVRDLRVDSGKGGSAGCLQLVHTPRVTDPLDTVLHAASRALLAPRQAEWDKMFAAYKEHQPRRLPDFGA